MDFRLHAQRKASTNSLLAPQSSPLVSPSKIISVQDPLKLNVHIDKSPLFRQNFTLIPLAPRQSFPLPIQSKLAISAQQDTSKSEADRVEQQVVTQLPCIQLEHPLATSTNKLQFEQPIQRKAYNNDPGSSEEGGIDITPWPKAEMHPIVNDKNIGEICRIKQELKEGKCINPKFISKEEIRTQSLKALEKLDKINTTSEVKSKIQQGYDNLLNHILGKLNYNGTATLGNATFLKEWSLTTAYLINGIPVWQSKVGSFLQTREKLGPHRLRESKGAFLEEEANKVLKDLIPGRYAFVVPLTFPLKKKIMIGPEPDINTTQTPQRSEGHSALSTKDKRKKNEQGKILLAKGVLFAGEVKMGANGEVLEWSNASGHYTISSKEAGQDAAGKITLDTLAKMGLPFPIEKYKDRS